MARPHAAALVEDAIHRRTSTLLHARGWRPRTISYTGYGSPGFVRVPGRGVVRPRPDQTAARDAPALGRVVPGRPQAQPAASDARASLRELYGAEEEQRGWRAFITAPAMGV